MIQELATFFRNLMLFNNQLKYSVILFLLILFSVQKADGQDIDWGIKGGINLANHYDERFEANHFVAFSAGAYSDFSFDDSPVSLQPEILYTRRGSKSSIQEKDIVLRGKLNTSYIEVPLMIAYTFDLFEVFQPKFFVGPSFSYLLNSKFKRDIDGKTFDIKPITNNIVWGAVGGLVMNFPTLTERLSLETRVSRGYTEIYKAGENRICCGEFDRTQKDFIISLLIGFEF